MCGKSLWDICRSVWGSACTCVFTVKRCNSWHHSYASQSNLFSWVLMWNKRCPELFHKTEVRQGLHLSNSTGKTPLCFFFFGLASLTHFFFLFSYLNLLWSLHAIPVAKHNLEVIILNYFWMIWYVIFLLVRFESTRHNRPL